MSVVGPCIEAIVFGDDHSVRLERALEHGTGPHGYGCRSFPNNFYQSRETPNLRIGEGSRLARVARGGQPGLACNARNPSAISTTLACCCEPTDSMAHDNDLDRWRGYGRYVKYERISDNLPSGVAYRFKLFRKPRQNDLPISDAFLTTRRFTSHNHASPTESRDAPMPAESTIAAGVVTN